MPADSPTMSHQDDSTVHAPMETESKGLHLQADLHMLRNSTSKAKQMNSAPVQCMTTMPRDTALPDKHCGGNVLQAGHVVNQTSALTVSPQTTIPCKTNTVAMEENLGGQARATINQLAIGPQGQCSECEEGLADVLEICLDTHGCNDKNVGTMDTDLQSEGSHKEKGVESVRGDTHEPPDGPDKPLSSPSKLDKHWNKNALPTAKPRSCSPNKTTMNPMERSELITEPVRRLQDTAQPFLRPEIKNDPKNCSTRENSHVSTLNQSPGHPRCKTVIPRPSTDSVGQAIGGGDTTGAESVREGHKALRERVECEVAAYQAQTTNNNSVYLRHSASSR
ncbi:hypothetical protein EDD16DRAFT_1522305 [Pisolithus croceorrhizus]|nr:hypothetical protein EDD16DRAFT_1522305 [Pisolithus croceorrhizus]